MNERIKELAKEVFSFKYKTAPNELNPGHHMDHLHKFAELIVKECIDTLERHHSYTKDPEAYLYAISIIEEHFGIKEQPVNDVDRILRTVRTRGIK